MTEVRKPGGNSKVASMPFVFTLKPKRLVINVLLIFLNILLLTPATSKLAWKCLKHPKNNLKVGEGNGKIEFWLLFFRQLLEVR